MFNKTIIDKINSLDIKFEEVTSAIINIVGESYFDNIRFIMLDNVSFDLIEENKIELFNTEKYYFEKEILKKIGLKGFEVSTLNYKKGISNQSVEDLIDFMQNKTLKIEKMEINSAFIFCERELTHQDLMKKAVDSEYVFEIDFKEIPQVGFDLLEMIKEQGWIIYDSQMHETYTVIKCLETFGLMQY